MSQQGMPGVDHVD
jgi:hypothetical protein